jgi:transcriptional regulator with XRE-family HTH domain
MPVRQGSAARGLARGRAIVSDLSRELEVARLGLGLSYADLGRGVGLSGQQVARICRGRSGSVAIVRMAGLLGAVGLDLAARAYPGGPPIRDAAHLALLSRLRARLATTLAWRAEVPVVASPAPVASGGRESLDRRAWDAVIEGRDWRVGVEAETRLFDIQALERRVALKQRDGAVTAVILLVNDTANNRRILGLDGPALRDRFPGSARATLHHLAGGLPPAANTLLVL